MNLIFKSLDADGDGFLSNFDVIINLKYRLEKVLKIME